MEKNRGGNEKLLVATNDKSYGKIYKRIQPMPKNKKPYRTTSRKADGK